MSVVLDARGPDHDRPDVGREQHGARANRRARTRALVIGAGGLGTPASLVLATAGIGTIGIVDDDVVALSNLHRQVLYAETDVGKRKVSRLGAALVRRMPSLVVREHATRFLPTNAMSLLKGYDVVLEGSDNFATKFLVADACRVAGVPVVHGAAVRWIGTTLTVGPAGRPCYRCLFEDLPREHAPNCSEAGVMGPVVGVVGALQADAALAIVDGEATQGLLVRFDGRTGETRSRAIRPRESCPLCGPNASFLDVDAKRYMEASCDIAW